MSTPMPDQYAPGEAYPDLAAADGPTRGAPVRDAVESDDGAAAWSAVAEPAAMPPAVEPVTDRVGWLRACR
jgi:hypothetical protein